MNNFDLFTMFIYIFIGLSASCLIKRAKKSNSCGIIDGKQHKLLHNGYYFLFFLVFIVFAVFRKVDENIGGSDALTYINLFLNSPNSSPEQSFVEPLFFWFMRLIRFFTSDYRIFFFVSYGIIIWSFIVFINKFAPNDIVYTPFLLIIWPYLKDFNTLRTGLAIAFILFGIVLMDKKWLCALFMIGSVFIHRTSIIWLPFFLFYFLWKNYVAKLKKWGFFLFIGVCIVGVYFLALIAQQFAIKLGLLDAKDTSYISSSLGVNIFSRWPIFIAQLFLLICMILFSNEIRKNKQLDFIKVCCVYDFIMVPVSLVLGIWRANEFFYLARLIMWGEIVRIVEMKVVPSQRFIVRIASVVFFVAWLCFRLVQEANELAIMPYVFQLFS